MVCRIEFLYYLLYKSWEKVLSYDILALSIIEYKLFSRREYSK